MILTSQTWATLLLILVSVLWGSTGIWSQIATLSSAEVVTGRTTVAAITLFLLVLPQGQFFRAANWQQPKWLIICAAALGLHWFCFFECMRQSSVALGLVTYTTCPLFCTLLEPLIKKEKIALYPIGCALIALVGIWYVHPITSWALVDLLPTAIGIASGFLMAVVSLIAVHKLNEVEPRVLSCTLNTIIGFCAWFIAPLSYQAITGRDISAILGLGILCSALGQSLFIYAARLADSRLATIVSTLEAPTGVFLAWYILDEHISLSTILGCLIVVFAVILMLMRKNGSPSVKTIPPSLPDV